LSDTVKRSDGWWIIGIPDVEDCGPYDSRGEADSDRRGMERTLKNINNHSYFTTEKPQ